jgi:hypothetical protein
VARHLRRLFFFFPYLLLASLFRSCVYLLLNYRMTVVPPLVDLVGFRPCAHFLSVYVCPQIPPPRFNFVRTYIILRALALFFLSFLAFSRLLSVFLRVVWLAFDTEESLPML